MTVINFVLTYQLDHILKPLSPFPPDPHPTQQFSIYKPEFYLENTISI